MVEPAVKDGMRSSTMSTCEEIEEKKLLVWHGGGAEQLELQFNLAVQRRRLPCESVHVCRSSLTDGESLAG